MSVSRKEDQKSLLIYYYDAECNLMLPRDPLGNFKATMDCKTPPRAGIDSVHTSFYVKNDHHFPMELKPETSDPDLSVTEYPEFLEPEEIGKVTLTFTPSKDRIKPLEGGSWDFTKIVYSKTS